MCVSLSQSVASGTVEKDDLVGVPTGVIATGEAWSSRIRLSLVQDPGGLAPIRHILEENDIFGEPDVKGVAKELKDERKRARESNGGGRRSIGECSGDFRWPR